MATTDLLSGMSVVEVVSSNAARFCGWVLASMGADVQTWDTGIEGATYLDTGREVLQGWFAAPKVSRPLPRVDELPTDIREAAERAEVLIVDSLVHRITWVSDLVSHHRGAVLVVTPFGLDGPDAGRAGSDLIAAHSSGYAYYVSGARPDLPPMRGPRGQARLFTGLSGAAAVIGAVRALRRGGGRRLLDLSEQDANASLLYQELAELNNGVHTGRRDFDGTTAAGGLVGYVAAADGALIFSPREQHQWQRVLDVMGRPAWSDDPRFATLAGRIEHWMTLQGLIGEWSTTLPRKEIFRRLQAARVACFPVNTLIEALRIETPTERGFWCPLGREQADSAQMPSLPFLVTDGPGTPGEEPPAGLRAPADPADGAPLAGVRVLDFSWVVGGPVCTRVLALLGAQVIKVESSSRPEHRKRPGRADLLNISKQSISLDLKTDVGRATARRLAARSDVVVENFGLGVMDRLGLGYETLSQDNPAIVMLSMSGLGRQGSGASLVAYGSLLQGYAGWLASMGQAVPGQSVLGQKPMGIRPAWTDQNAGAAGAVAILAALVRKELRGIGAYLDLSMLETLLLTQAEALASDLTERARPASPNGSNSVAPHGCYRCSGDDDWVAIGIYSADQWRRLVDVMGEPSWTTGLDDVDRRLERSEEIDERIAAWTGELDVNEAVKLLVEAGVPTARSGPIQALCADDNFRLRGVYVRLDDDQMVIGTPWIDSRAGRGVCRPAPVLGENTDEVLRDVLNLDDEEIGQLRSEGVLT